VIELSARATRHVAQLEIHYGQLGRPEAIRNLAYALAEAIEKIRWQPHAGLPAPRPYPHLAKPGRLWLHVRRYWIAYSTATPPVIVAIFYETANIPKRL
jgi:plasmid stabilization system protein ParE